MKTKNLSCSIRTTGVDFQILKRAAERSEFKLSKEQSWPLKNLFHFGLLVYEAVIINLQNSWQRNLGVVNSHILMKNLQIGLSVYEALMCMQSVEQMAKKLRCCQPLCRPLPVVERLVLFYSTNLQFNLLDFRTVIINILTHVLKTFVCCSESGP